MIMKSWKMFAFVLCAIFGANASTLLAQEKSAFSSATIDLAELRNEDATAIPAIIFLKNELSKI